MDWLRANLCGACNFTMRDPQIQKGITLLTFIYQSFNKKHKFLMKTQKKKLCAPCMDCAVMHHGPCKHGGLMSTVDYAVMGHASSIGHARLWTEMRCQPTCLVQKKK